MTEPQVIAEFTDYSGMRRALQLAREKRDMSFDLLDEITGAPKGFFSKTLGPGAVRRIGMQSLGWACGGLGIKCIVVEDPEALKCIATRLRGRNPRLVRNGAVHMTLSIRSQRKNGRKGGTNSRKNMTRSQARKMAKKAARARWDAVRKLVKAARPDITRVKVP